MDIYEGDLDAFLCQLIYPDGVHLPPPCVPGGPYLSDHVKFYGTRR